MKVGHMITLRLGDKLTARIRRIELDKFHFLLFNTDIDTVVDLVLCPEPVSQFTCDSMAAKSLSDAFRVNGL